MPPSELTAAELRGWPLPQITGTKDDRGRVLVIGGARDTAGAVRLAGEAALRAGAGKLQLACAQSRAAAMAVAVPEALVLGLPEATHGRLGHAAGAAVRHLTAECDVVLVGPGLAGAAESRAMVEAVLPVAGGAVVLDALALAAVSPQGPAPSAPQGALVLTPNPTELAVSLGRDVAEVTRDLPGAVTTLARQTGAAVRCGAVDAVIASADGRCWIDRSGPPGLGVSGSGDVLAGIVAGLLARGAEPEQALLWASRLHGTAGGRLAARLGPVGYLARELAGELPCVLAELA